MIVQKSKSKAINDELQSTFNDMSQLAMHGVVNPPTGISQLLKNLKIGKLYMVRL